MLLGGCSRPVKGPQDKDRPERRSASEATRVGWRGVEQSEAREDSMGSLRKMFYLAVV